MAPFLFPAEGSMTKIAVACAQLLTNSDGDVDRGPTNRDGKEARRIIIHGQFQEFYSSIEGGINEPTRISSVRGAWSIRVR